MRKDLARGCGACMYDGRLSAWVLPYADVPQRRGKKKTTSFLFRAGRIGALLVYIQYRGLFFFLLPTRLVPVSDAACHCPNPCPCHVTFAKLPCMYVGLLRLPPLR
ncbi:hypothetical protein K445DRAFT_176565 [Daldinia sp. EC12]|nr:hypothetical protein K445DRAFT_176565 [Daldinia sp. EC12]